MATIFGIRPRIGRQPLLAAVIAVFGLCVVASKAQAIPMVAGDEFAASGEAKPVGGLVIAGGIPVNFVAKTFSGSLTSWVIQGDTSNTLNGLTFVYEFTNDAKSPNAVTQFTIQDFELALFQTDVSYSTLTGGVVPFIQDRVTADVVGFRWFGPIIGPGVVTPGSTSARLVIQTDATLYKVIQANVIDGSTANPLSYGPTAVPEPGTMALAGIGGVGLAIGWARRRYRRS